MDAELLGLVRWTCELINIRAWWALKHSAELPPSISGDRPFHGIPRLCLWSDVAGTCADNTASTLCVFEVFGTDNITRYPVVREAIWQRGNDLRDVRCATEQKRMRAVIDPTISVRDGHVPPNELEDLLREATSFHVPAVWLKDTGAVTTSGGTFGVEFFSREQPAAVVRLEWSSSMPPTWAPIIGWTERMRRFLVGRLATVGAR